MIRTVAIQKKGIFVDGKIKFFPSQSEQFLNDYYLMLEINYPKFYKMDPLAKLGILAQEAMVKDHNPFDGIEDDSLSLIFSNRSSSFDSDEKFMYSYSTLKSPSPSLFVYTLPNIMMGELCIKNKWYGENTFFIRPKIDFSFLLEQAKIQFEKGAKHCLCAWIEFKNNQVDCFMFYLDKGKNIENYKDFLNLQYKLATQ
ncbi:MAG: hypothetical protein HYU67_06300 [Flavobacteriia bacterium]|nr:hypothetical protein [Flavobacteriia bacterium]